MNDSLSLRFLGVGSAQSVALGSSSAVLERDQRPLLMIDCGPDSLPAFHRHYGQDTPPALFVTHCHFDHIGGLESLFYRLATGELKPQLPRLFIPVSLLPVLQRRLADFPNLLAEGGANFWDLFQLIPVSERFWLGGYRLDVFPVRHHEYGAAFGLALRGAFLYTGDTRPIPEVLNRYACAGERIFHDCGLTPNPSHTGLAELAGEYTGEQCARLVLYHYNSVEEARAMARAGHAVARAGECFPLRTTYTEPDVLPLDANRRDRQTGT